MEIQWDDNDIQPAPPIYFDDLSVNDTFRIVDSQAVYMKVKLSNTTYYMLELYTGKLFQPTHNAVELISVVAHIGIPKPRIYKTSEDFIQFVDTVRHF